MLCPRVFFVAAMLSALAVAAALRLPRLDLRPMHADEANQATRAALLYESGEYEYDAKDHHGPSLYWLTLPSLAGGGVKGLADSKEVQYRIVPALFGVALIGLLLLLTDGLGSTAVAAAAVLLAVSPAMVFYSRYYIQETLLVFFTLAAIGCGWRYVRTRRLAWILATGAAIGMMHATKETWVLSAAAATAATGFTWLWARLNARYGLAQGKDEGAETLRPENGMLIPLFLGILVACIVAILLFTMFGKNWHALWDSIACYANYLRRGSERGDHSEPWYYYLQILFAYHPAKRFFWSEGLIAALALIGGTYSLTGAAKSHGGSPTLPVFLTFYTLLLVALYSAISYKTPWCALGLLLGMVLMAGVGVGAIYAVIWSITGSSPETAGTARDARSVSAHREDSKSRPRSALGLQCAATTVLTIGIVHLAWQAYRLNFNPTLVADSRNPYVYAHTPQSLARLAEQLDQLRQHLISDHGPRIHVVVKENYWPLPWYFRKFKPDTVAYWLDPLQWQNDLRRLPTPDVLILSADFESPELLAQLSRYNGQIRAALRPGVFVRIYLRDEFWPAFLDVNKTTAGLPNKPPDTVP